jgi:hypothetical protein
MSLDRRILYSNNAKSTLAAGIGTTDLAFSSQPGEGLLFSNPSGAECFLVTFRDAFGNYEIMVISARSTDTFTVLTRGVDGTNARSWVAGAKIEQRATALILNQLVSQLGQSVFAVGGGTGNAITAVFDPPFTALINGMEVRVRAPAANTSVTPTFAPDGLTAKTIVKFNNTALVAGEIVGVSHELLLRYSSTLDKWLLLNPVFPYGKPIPVSLGGTGSGVVHFGSWVPSVTFVTPGDLVVAYDAFRNGRYTILGKKISVHFYVVLLTFTHSTASGDLLITGLEDIPNGPGGVAVFADHESPGQYFGALAFGGITKAGYTQFALMPDIGSNLQLIIKASGSGVAPDNVKAADMPSGGSVILQGSVTYRVI